MRKYLNPHGFSGRLAVLPSKSASHRALLCAALAAGESTVAPLQKSEDIVATSRCLEALGLENAIEWTPYQQVESFATCRLQGGGAAPSGGLRHLDCGESGSTLRFLLPLALDGRGPVCFRGAGRLMERPLTPYERLFLPRGFRWEASGQTLTVEGALQSGRYELPGDVSSQFVTGLLYALPRLPGDSEIRLTTPLESRGYVDMTLEALGAAGIRAGFTDAQTLAIPGGQAFTPGAFTVTGDWSHAAFFLVAGAVGGDVLLTGLDPASAQGDRAIVPILRQMGVDITQTPEGFRARKSPLTGIQVDVRDVPDLVPALCVAACAAQGETRITGAARLRLKESDRLAVMASELRKLGADITEEPEGLRIQGGTPLRFARVEGHNDHRIAMALAIAACLSPEGLELDGVEAVKKSAPRFWEEWGGLACEGDEGEGRRGAAPDPA